MKTNNVLRGIISSLELRLKGKIKTSRFANIYIMSNCLRTLAIILALSVSLIPASNLLAAGSTNVNLMVPAGVIEPGNYVTVNVYLQPNQPIAGAQFSLSFNPEMVKVESITEGDLLKQDGANTYFTSGQINNNLGTVSGVFGAITSPGNTVSSPGTFAVVNIVAGSTGGSCPLTLSGVIVGNINGQSVPTSLTNGNIAINRTPDLNPIGNKSIDQGSTLSFAISAIDGDGDSLTYSASNVPSGALFNPSTRTFLWTPNSNQLGVFSGVHFEVSDSMSIDYENITITVNHPTSTDVSGGNGKTPQNEKISSGITDISKFVNNDGLFNQEVKAASSDSLVELTIPQNTRITYDNGQATNQVSIVNWQVPPSLPENTANVGAVYTLQPMGARFDSPIDISIKYDPTKVPSGVEAKDLVIGSWNNSTSKWSEFNSYTDLGYQTVNTKINSFSNFSILAHVKPADFQIKNLSVAPLNSSRGDKLTFTAEVLNSGDISGQFDASLTVNNRLIETRTISLTGSEKQVVTYYVIADQIGHNTVNLGGLDGEFDVKALPAANFVYSPIKLSSAEGTVGKALSVSTSITNIGDAAGFVEANLLVNGQSEAVLKIYLNTGESQELTFPIVENQAGIYSLEINGIGTTVTMKDSPNSNEQSAPVNPDEPTETEFSLSLLVEILAGAFIFTTILTTIILVQRRKMMQQY